MIATLKSATYPFVVSQSFFRCSRILHIIYRHNVLNHERHMQENRRGSFDRSSFHSSNQVQSVAVAESKSLSNQEEIYEEENALNDQQKSVNRKSTSKVRLDVNNGHYFHNGTACIVAESCPNNDNINNGTQFTTISHKSPARVIPMLSSNVSNAGAAVAVLSNYGGGLLPGDSLQYDITCRGNKAKLALTTQGSNRIYRQQQQKEQVKQIPEISTADYELSSTASRSRINVTVERGGTIVIAPDPVSVFTDSIYVQEQKLTFSRDSNFCWIDWISSGRYLSGEQWQQRSLQTTASVYVSDVSDGRSSDLPVLIDSIAMKQRTDEINKSLDSNSSACDWGLKNWSNGYYWNAFATLLVYGSTMDQVIDRCNNLQTMLMQPYAKVRSTSRDLSQTVACYGENYDISTKALTYDDLSLSGRVMMGISKVEVPAPPTTTIRDRNLNNRSVHVIRFAAMSNEDLYRIFHTCLLSLKPELGIELYKDRIRSSSAQRLNLLQPKSVTTIVNKYSRNKAQTLLPSSNNSVTSVKNMVHKSADIGNESAGNYWAAYMLADSALPTGSFAHSCGLEVAHQLGLISTPDDVLKFVECATKSTMQQSAPFLVYCSILLNRLQQCHQNSDSDPPTKTNQLHNFVGAWRLLDQQANARLVSNGPACRTSLEQGHNLLRVAMQVAKNNSKMDTETTNAVNDLEILQILSNEITSSKQSSGHLSTLFGIVASILQLSQKQACELLGYCIARDIVSAAVRLSLLGPLASVNVLSNAQEAAEEGFDFALQVVTPSMFPPDLGVLGNDFDSELSFIAKTSSSCFPLLDTIQPCHDVLATRLFRT